jgi:hypothetical protein
VASGAAPLSLLGLAAGHADALGNPWALLRAAAPCIAGGLAALWGCLAPGFLDAINPSAHHLLAPIGGRGLLTALLAAQSMGSGVGRGASLWCGPVSIGCVRTAPLLVGTGS